MTLFAYVGSSDMAFRVRLGAFGLESTATGGVGVGDVWLEDTDGTCDIQGWRFVRILETACTPAPVLATGFVGFWRETQIGPDGIAIAPPGRWLHFELIDQNELLAIRVITNPDGKRPAETHNARINWLLGSTYNAGPVIDDGLVDTSHPRPFDAADYRGQVPQDVLADIAGPIFKLFFVYPIQPYGLTWGLFFANPTTYVASSPLSISNVLGDQSDTCFPPSTDTEVAHDPTTIYSLVRYVYAKGLVLEGNTTTQSTYFAAAATGGPELGNRGENVENSRIGSEASARIMADGLLDKAASETDTITTTIWVPEDQVGFIQPGWSISFRDNRFPRYSTASFVRIQTRSLYQTGMVASNNRRVYECRLILSNGGILGSGGGGAPVPGDFPHPPTGPLSIIQQSVGLSSRAFSAAPSDGDTLVIVASKRTVAPDPSALGYVDSGEGNVTHGTDYVKAAQKTASGDVATLGASLDQAAGWYELSAGATKVAGAHADGSGYVASTASVTVPAGGIAFAVAGIGSGGGFDAGAYDGPPTSGGANLAWQDAAGWTRDFNARVSSGHPSSLIARYINDTGTAQSITPSFSFYNDGQGPWPWQLIVVVYGPDTTASDNPPQPAQWVYDETPTPSPNGLITTFTTLHPFADGSLRVFVDKVEQTAAITSYDGACGEFTLGFAPRSWETILVNYQGR